MTRPVEEGNSECRNLLNEILSKVMVIVKATGRNPEYIKMSRDTYEKLSAIANEKLELHNGNQIYRTMLGIPIRIEGEDKNESLRE